MYKNEGLFNRKPPHRLEKKVETALMKMTSKEASAVKMEIEGDFPVTIHCGGSENHWESAWLAYHYYLMGAMACDGSEANRYWSVVTGLMLGVDVPSDGLPVREAS